MKNIAIQNSILAPLLLALSMATNSSIQGNITNSKTSQNLMGANIILEGTILGSASDENGHYTINDIPIGSYTMKVMYIGFESLEKEIRIKGNQEYTIDIILAPSAIELQETKVTAEKRKGKVTNAPASIEIITSRDIKRESTTNIGSYLKGLKGVDFTSSGINNYSISIRGFNSSFNTRVLTLTDGRVANIPALRVINYSAVPQSMDDIDRMEVILGPATALYGANAHSGVVNIISKPPALSEGLTMSVAGSNDERELRKINGRWAKKLTKNFSFKLSGTYLHGYEWPYISEEEYKSHLYPWTGNPYRMYDGKDNNPWNNRGGHTDSSYSNVTNRWYLIGNGEQMDTGDPDGDGVMGEDWFNGYDDDGDCPGDTNQDGCLCCTGDIGVDEDYFIANGIDDDGDGEIDENIDIAHDVWTDGYDNDGNGLIDDNLEKFNNDSGTNFDPPWSYNLENRNVIIEGGRGLTTIHGKPNHWYDQNATINTDDLRGNYYYDEEQVKYLFDIYIYDFGADGVPGDPFIDKKGDGQFQVGECLGVFGGFTDDCDCGLDGICEFILTNQVSNPNPDWSGADEGEGDGQWQPGDGWVDDGDGVVDLGNFGTATQDTYVLPDENDYNDVWPPYNGIWDEGELVINDYGQDGLADTGDFGEGDGHLIPWDSGEKDNMFDTGDGIYSFQGEDWIDCNDDLTICENDANWDATLGNGRWNTGETFTDINGDQQYTPPDYVDNFQFVDDVNGDGISDYPDFEVENRKVDLRLDFDPSSNFNMTFQGGYSWTKTQQVTGTSRYLADGFEYKYYQLRGRFHNWYSQIYMNESFSGNTRAYNLGNVIEDRSKNYAFQLQRNDDLETFNTTLVWGIDYFKTLPSTNGSILNDGPNGYDNDDDNLVLGFDNIDNDGDGQIDEITCDDGVIDGFLDGLPDDSRRKDGKPWGCGEGIDEEDEFINPESNEYGFYYQTKTELFGTSRYELITAARWDNHDLLDEGVQFAPKIGFIYKPDEKSSFRLTYGKAFNTPNSITMYTDLHVRKQGILDIYLRGNKDGTPYCRVGQICSGSEDFNAAAPGYYYCDGYYTEEGICVGDMLFNNISQFEDNYFSGEFEDGCSNDNFLNEQSCAGAGHDWDRVYSMLPYSERVNGAPYFFKLDSDPGPADMYPLDTARYLIYVSELNGDGVLYTAEESFNIPNVDPIKTEKIQTIELGYKGFVTNRTHLTVDYYISYYEDFFSPPTIITPSVVLRYDAEGNEVTDINDLSFVGFMTVNSFKSYAPYGTAWNGIDDDGDWNEWNGQCDANGTCFDWGNTADQGEWGFVSYAIPGDPTSPYTLYHPEDVAIQIDGGISIPPFVDSEGNTINPTFFVAVGVDEYDPSAGLNEAELVLTGIIGEGGEQLYGKGRANSPPHLVLSPMNYGDVWMQGVDMGITQLVPEHNLIIDGNISWYGTTEFYNELTKKNDPINAPEWKWNASIKWDPPSLGGFALNYRHVNEFKWNDGIWAGIIGPYDIFDFHYNYELTKNVKLSISALNFLDDHHKELIGGAKMGKQVIMRITSIF